MNGPAKDPNLSEQTSAASPHQRENVSAEDLASADRGETSGLEPSVRDWSTPPSSEFENAPERRDGEAWRDELSARLDRYRERRKVRPPRYPSLSLPFDAVVPVGSPDAPTAVQPSAFEPRSDRALALEGTAPTRRGDADGQSESAPAKAPAQPDPPAAAPPAVPRSGAKIIEFPRFDFGPPAPPTDQLAEPVSDHPRILEAPEVEPPLPALGGIIIEPAPQLDPERRPRIDVPLESATLARRIFATLVDGLIVAGAAALFGVIFWKVAAIRLPLPQLLEMAASSSCLFWAIYQYLLIVYGGSTLGLRAAGLELSRFDGTSTSRSVRRWRVLASYLSAASLGMGYAWVFLDEDALCWHDRITHTYLAPKKP